jgi:hypothetical protein
MPRRDAARPKPRRAWRLRAAMLLATPLAAVPAAAQFSSVKSKSAPVSND